MVTGAEVVPVSVYFTSDVVSADVPVTIQRLVPDAPLSSSLARGNIVPALAVFFIHSVKVTVEPAGRIPAAFGSPAWESSSLIRYSPAARLRRSTDWSAAAAASGGTGLSLRSPAVEDASL